MVWVPGSEFTMGSDGSNSRPDEGPAHRVRVDGFWMDITATIAAYLDIKPPSGSVGVPLVEVLKK